MTLIKWKTFVIVIRIAQIAHLSDKSRDKRGRSRTPKGTDRHKGGHSHDPNKRKKGPHRSRAPTRGYDSNKTGKHTRPDYSVPIDKSAKKNTCSDCRNKTPAGRKVVGHNPGDPICPKVKSKQTPRHPKWDKIMKEYPSHENRETVNKHRKNQKIIRYVKPPTTV